MDSLWTTELHEEAVARYQFIVVTPIGLPRVNVTDMKVIWALYPDFIFNTKYRIAGKKEDILKQMENVGYAEEDLTTVFEDIENDSITSENFETVPEDSEYSPYDVEIAYYNQWKDEYLESQKGAKGLTLLELFKALNPHMSLVEEKKVVPRIPTGSGRGASGLGIGKQAKPEPRETTPSPTKGKVGRKSTTLQDKIDKLAEDKLINVTKITATGTGTSAVIKRQKTSLFVSPNLPLTSSSLEGILLALDMLGGEDEYPDDYQAALDFKWKDGSKTASPKTTSTTSTTSTKAPSKTVVPEAVLPPKTKLLPPPSATGRKPSLVSGLSVPENSEI